MKPDGTDPSLLDGDAAVFVEGSFWCRGAMAHWIVAKLCNCSTKKFVFAKADRIDPTRYVQMNQESSSYRHSSTNAVL